MPVEVLVHEFQTLEVGIDGPDEANRMYITTGKLKVNLQAEDFPGGGSPATNKETYTVLLGPQFDRGQFHRAVVTASITGVAYAFINPPSSIHGEWDIEEAQADLDDESGKVQLRVTTRAHASGTRVTIKDISFQVTTLARV